MDPDFEAMWMAYKALSSIPVDSNRREAALWWLRTRVSTEIQHERDRRQIEATRRVMLSLKEVRVAKKEDDNGEA